MNVLTLSKNNFGKLPINKDFFYYTDSSKNIKQVQLYNDRRFLQIYHHNDGGFYSEPLESNYFTKRNDNEYITYVHGIVYYVHGYIHVSGPCTIELVLYSQYNNRYYSFFKAKITKECNFYISDYLLCNKGGWSDNSYISCYIYSGSAIIDCSKLLLTNWIY